jgi:hypothetical protein
MITQEGLSTESLLEILKTAFVEASLDPDNDIVTKEDFHVYVQVPSGANAIRFMSQFTANPSADAPAVLVYVNRVNQNLRLPRAYSIDGPERRAVVFDQYVYIDAGIAESSFVSALRRFHRSIRSAVDQDTENALS